MNYSEKQEGEWTIQEQIDVLDSQIKKKYLQIAGNATVTMFIPLLGIGLNMGKHKEIKELKRQKKELTKQLN